MKPKAHNSKAALFAAAALTAALVTSCSEPGSPPENQSPPGGAESSAAAPGQDFSPILHELTQALRKFSAEKQRVPASLNELVSAGYLSALPAAPSGQKFVINPSRVEVILADE